MSDLYYVECSCGHAITVELFEAGTQKTCPSCQSLQRVPSSVKLREISGDKTPFLSLLGKIRHAVEHAEPPFDGRCHGCKTTIAEHQISIVLSIMEERTVSDDDDDFWVLPLIYLLLRRIFGRKNEEWQATTFPLLLCKSCFTQFRSARIQSKLWHAVGTAMLVISFCGIIWAGNHIGGFVAILLAVPWFALVVALIQSLQGTRRRGTRRISRFVTEYLCKIRWVVDVVNMEDEYMLQIGKPAEFYQSQGKRESRQT